ncbi:MAG TPA: hypothetical protein VJH04_03960 [archaeon]|nr:hypothetical protein [archaeon]
MMEKKKVEQLNCKCGHDVMLHGFQNMGCSVILTKIENGSEVSHKCPCGKFERQ